VSERDSDKVRKMVTDTDGMFMSEVIKNLKSVINKRREMLASVRLYIQSKIWKICETWGFYVALDEDSRLEEYEALSDFQDF
jgi:uncharacterized protein YydD (DUF2326 family)